MVKLMDEGADSFYGEDGRSVLGHTARGLGVVSEGVSPVDRSGERLTERNGFGRQVAL